MRLTAHGPDVPNVCDNNRAFASSSAGTSSGGVSPTRREQPLFTLRQVGMICERLLKEREEKVREEYEETMTSKLAGGLVSKANNNDFPHVCFLNANILLFNLIFGKWRCLE